MGGGHRRDLPTLEAGVAKYGVSGKLLRKQGRETLVQPGSHVWVQSWLDPPIQGGHLPRAHFLPPPAALQVPSTLKAATGCSPFPHTLPQVHPENGVCLFT